MADVIDVDLRQLKQVVRSMHAASGPILREVEEFAQGELDAAVSDVFDAEGPGWAPTLRGGATLRDTGAMSGSFEVGVQSPGVLIGSFGVPYAIFHITGTSRMPKRNPLDLGMFEKPMIDSIIEFAGECAMRRLR